MGEIHIMYFKKILLLFLLMICVLFTVSGISAGDVDDAQDIASLSDVEEELDVSIDNPVDGDLLEQDSGDEVISAAQSSSWTELNTLINGNNNDYIELTKDYNFYNDKYDKQFQTGIPIKRSLTISQMFWGLSSLGKSPSLGVKVGLGFLALWGEPL